MGVPTLEGLPFDLSLGLAIGVWVPIKFHFILTIAKIF
jgi:hypothetical protein